MIGPRTTGRIGYPRIRRTAAIPSISRAVLALLVSGFVAKAAAQTTKPYDLILTGGTVVDGSGAPRDRADIGIRDDRIATIARGGLAGQAATETLDCTGLIVAPGFIDNHAHVAKAIADHPLAENIGFFAGHSWIRTRVLGLENRAPTAAELDHMRALVDSAMVQGALGLSVGLEYVPPTSRRPRSSSRSRRSRRRMAASTSPTCGTKARASSARWPRRSGSGGKPGCRCRSITIRPRAPLNSAGADGPSP